MSRALSEAHVLATLRAQVKHLHKQVARLQGQNEHLLAQTVYLRAVHFEYVAAREQYDLSPRRQGPQIDAQTQTE